MDQAATLRDLARRIVINERTAKRTPELDAEAVALRQRFDEEMLRKKLRDAQRTD